MSNELIQTTKKPAEVEYIPFGASEAEKIKLTVNIIRNMIAVPTADGDLPDDRECMKFMMLCRSRKLNPFEGDAWLIGFRSRRSGRVEWSLISAHSAFLKRAEVSPEYDGKRSGIIIDPPMMCNVCDGSGRLHEAPCPTCSGRGTIDELEGDFIPEQINGQEVRLVGGWCRVYYKTRKYSEYQRLKLSTYRKENRQWEIDTGGMICKCAEAAALRAAFPNTLGGLYLEQERAVFSDSVSAPIVPPKFKPALPVGGPPPVKPEVPDPSVGVPSSEPAPEPPPPGQPEPPPTRPEPPPKRPEPPPKINVLKAVRLACREAKLKEDDVLFFLKDLGSIDEDIKALEEVALQAPDVLQMVCDQWKDISGRILAVKAKEANE